MIQFCPHCCQVLNPGKPCFVCRLVSINTILAVGRKVGMPTRKES